MKCKCLVEASQVVLLFNNRCSALHFPLLESVQIEEGPCQNLLRGSEEKYSQSPAHKGDMKKGEKGGGGMGGESEIRSDSTQKCMWEHIIKKRGVFVWVRTLWSELIATGILGLLRVKTPQKAFQHLSINFFASATFYLFLFVFAQSYNHFYVQFGQINTNTQLENATYPHIGTAEYVKSSVTPIKKKTYTTIPKATSKRCIGLSSHGHSLVRFRKEN